MLMPETVDLTEIEARMRLLEGELRRHSHLYYSEGTPEISDEAYDALERELLDLELAHPDLKAPDTPTERIEDGISTLFDPVRHAVAMLSLEKAYTREELEAFSARFPDQTLVIGPKFDGVSISFRYENGKLVRAATRGDGEVGEDVTQNIPGMKNVPAQLSEPVTAEIRGEVVMLRSDWAAYNAANPDKQLANPRNAAAGTLRAKTREKVADRPLTFMPFDLIEDGVTHDVVARIEQLGFATEGFELVDGIEQVQAYIDQVAATRADRDYELDGVVIRLADRAAYEAAGARSKTPRGAIAFKLAAERTTTKLNSITVQVGKSGINALVAELEPVFLAGTTIRRATLHNLKYIEDKDIRVGDTVEILRAGDVIPRVDRSVPERRTGDEVVFAAPTACASCGGPLAQEGESKVLRCENTQGCPAQSLRRLIHWASRASADIDAIGASWIEVFLDAGLVTQPSDFYRLTYADLRPNGEKGDGAFDRMGHRLAEKMLASIDASRGVGLRKAIIGWSIPFCSEGTAKRLCRAGYESVEQVMAASREELEAIEDIGPVVAESIVKFFSLAATGAEIAALREHGVSLDVRDEDRPPKIASSSPLAGKTVVFTGKLEAFDRKAGESLVERAGGKASGSISKSTSLLVAGPGAGSKLAKAESLGVEVIDEAEFLQRARQAGLEV